MGLTTKMEGRLPKQHMKKRRESSGATTDDMHSKKRGSLDNPSTNKTFHQTQKESKGIADDSKHQAGSLDSFRKKTLRQKKTYSKGVVDGSKNQAGSLDSFKKKTLRQKKTLSKGVADDNKHQAGSLDSFRSKVPRLKKPDSKGGAADEWNNQKRQTGSLDDPRNKMLCQRETDFKGVVADEMNSKKRQTGSLDNSGNKMLYQRKTDFKGIAVNKMNREKRQAGSLDNSGNKMHYQSKREFEGVTANEMNSKKRQPGSVGNSENKMLHQQNTDFKGVANGKMQSKKRKSGSLDSSNDNIQLRKKVFQHNSEALEQKKNLQDKSDVWGRKKNFHDRLDVVGRKKGFEDRSDVVEQKKSLQDKSEVQGPKKTFQYMSDVVGRKKGLQDRSDVAGRKKGTQDKSSVAEGCPKRKKRLGISPLDISSKRMDDRISVEGNISENKVDTDRNAEVSKNAQFRAIQPNPIILSFVEDNLLGRRRLIELRRAGYNIELPAPLDNVPSSTSLERDRIEETVFRNRLTFFAAAKVASSFPPADLPEIAFAGRSNVGKSSLLNALTRQWGVVRTSDKPGLTQTINFFNLGPKHRLVDLPGYGFAYAKEEVKDAWEELVKEYVSTRVGLKRVCLLIDTKWGMKPRDHELIDLMERSQTKYQIVLTKTDVVFPIDVARRAMQIEENLMSNKSVVQPVMMVSSTSGAGIQSLRTVIGKFMRFVKL